MIKKQIESAKLQFLKVPGKYEVFSVNGLTSYYAPFDSVNLNAKVLILGITPGTTQFDNSLAFFTEARKNGLSDDRAMDLIKSKASFSGPLRSNLVRMLNHIGLHKKLGVESTAQLFEAKKDLAHFSSFIRYPTYYKDKPYNGSPNPLKNESLIWMIENVLIPELLSLESLDYIIPVGGKVEKVMMYVASINPAFKDKLLCGLPHPSGANSERIAYFLGNKCKSDLSIKTNPQIIDDARKALLEKLNMD